jgi:hypothetical protein
MKRLATLLVAAGGLALMLVTFTPQLQRRLGLGLAPLSLLRRLHVPLPIRLLSVLALSASLGRLRLVLATGGGWRRRRTSSTAA